MFLTQFKQLIHIHWKRLLGISVLFAGVLFLFLIIRIVVYNTNIQISEQIKPIAGADITVESSTGFDENFDLYIDNLERNYDITTTETISLSTNISTIESGLQLATLLGVQDEYPLYGELDVQRTGETDLVLGMYTGALVDEQTYEDAVIDDKIQVGSLSFPVTGILLSTPSSGFSFVGGSRIIYIPYAMVEETGLTQLGSRLEYETLIKVNDESQQQNILTTLRGEREISGPYQVSGISQRLGQISSVTDQFDSFVTYIVIIAAVIASSSVYILLMTFFATQRTYIGIRELLGTPKGVLRRLYTLLFGSGVIGGRVVSIVFSYISLLLLRTVPLTADFIMPISVIAQSFVIACVLGIIGVCIPLYTTLSKPALELLAVQDSPTSRLVYIQGFMTIIGIGLVYYISTQDVYGALLAVVALTFVALIYIFLTIYILKAFQKITQKYRDSDFGRWDGVRSTLTPGNQTALISGGIVLALTSLIIIGSLSFSFGSKLNEIRSNGDGFIVLNVLSENLEYIYDTYTDPKLYDIILSRIQDINGIPLNEHLDAIRLGSQPEEVVDNQEQEGGGRGGGGRFGREFNATSIQLPSSDYIIGSPPQPGEVSLAADFATDLGVDIGDQITYFIQGREFTLSVTSLRSINQDGSSPFFYVQYNEQEFAQAPKTYFRLNDLTGQDKNLFRSTVLENLGPHVSFIDTSEIIETVTDITSKVLTIILILTTCILILVSISIGIALRSMSRLKQTKIKLYHLVGASRDLIAHSLSTELQVIISRGILVSLLLGVAGVYTSITLAPLLEFTWSIWFLIGLLVLCTYILITRYGKRVFGLRQ